ncbi:tetratricopeptide repeat protein [Streptomyces cyaneofuscatus]
MTEKLSGIAATVKGILDDLGEIPEAEAWLLEALPALQAAAEDGDLGAQNVFGGVLLEVEGNPAEAFLWFTRTADRGSPMGKRSLGVLYANGAGVEKDTKRAEELFSEAAELGDPYAKFNLAQIWWGKKDPSDVAGLLRSAAESGILDASVVLGDLLSSLDRDEEAFGCYIKAAEGGHDRAMYVVACWYRDGIHVQVNKVEALMWFFRMLEVGNGDGMHPAIIMVRGMTDADIRRAGELSAHQQDAEALVGTVRKYR